MRVVLGVMVGHTGHRGVHLGAAERLRVDDFTRGRLDQRWAAKKDRAVAAHDDRLVAHRRDVGATSRARTHHHGNLRNVQRRHARLVVEDPTEVLLVRKHLVLQRQKRAAGVHQVDAGQMIFQGHLLCAQMLLYRHRKVGAALDRGIVGHDQHFAAIDPADAGDQAGARRGVVVHAVGRQCGQLKKW